MNSISRVGRPVPIRMASGRRRVPAGRIARVLIAAMLALLTVAPLFWMVSSALKGSSDFYSVDLIPAHPTLDNFGYMFNQASLPRYMLNTFFVAGVVTFLGLWFHSMAGYALARLHFPGRDILFFAIFCTLLISLPVILVPLFILVKTLGMLNSYWGLIVPAVFNAYGIFLLRQFYLGIPRELEEAAVMDGAGYWGIYWRVILPLSSSILSALAVLFFLANWNSFLWPLVITNDSNLWLVQVAIANLQQQYSASWNYIMAASVVVAIPTIVLFVVFQRQLVESIKTSGLK